MKIAVIQPYFSTDKNDLDKLISWELTALDKCDDSIDMIVLPECSHRPVLVHTKEEYFDTVDKYNDLIVTKACETAKRCRSMVFINAAHETATGWRNTTYCINRDGEVVGHYYKQHLVRGELNKLDKEYSLDYEPCYVLEMEGYRFAFLVCYDTYFYEYFSQIARENVDFVIGCSMMRSDEHFALDIFNRFLAYNTNAYVVRSSMSIGEDSLIGGCSMVVSPKGEILMNMKSEIGMQTVEIDPSEKYYKPAGYGNPPAAHYAYIEDGRRPWKYRPGGAAIVRYDEWMNYPRVCAHRGFNTVAPENSMPAWGSAIALGADEIEFDIWFTKDEEIVSTHDIELERVSDGEGWVVHKTYDELSKLDFGYKTAKHFKGLKIVRFEDILCKFAGQTIFNIHVKDHDFNKERVLKIAKLLQQYDCVRHSYVLAPDHVLPLFKEFAPQITLNQGHVDSDPWGIVDRAVAHGCKKLQFFKDFVTKELIDKAHANDIICNLFYIDDPDEVAKYLDMGIDTILTNDYLAISQAVNKWKAEHDK